MTESQFPEFVHPRVLKINVGFILAEGAGFQRDIELDLPRVKVGGDLELDYVRGTLRMSRNSRGIFVHGKLASAIVGECARCLEATQVPVMFEIEELFAYRIGDGAPVTLASSSDLGDADERSSAYARRFHRSDPAVVARQSVVLRSISLSVFTWRTS